MIEARALNAMEFLSMLLHFSPAIITFIRSNVWYSVTVLHKFRALQTKLQLIGVKVNEEPQCDRFES